MTHGKNICKQLKEVRKRIAEENNIPLEIEECTYKGECRGTCPRCGAELRYLENTLAERLRIGKVATVAGLALGLATTAQAQTPQTNTKHIQHSHIINQQNAEVKISGIIVDANTNELLPFAHVQLRREGDTVAQVAHADMDGKFSFSLRPGHYLMKITMVGYKIHKIEINAGVDVFTDTIKLVPDAVKLEEINIINERLSGLIEISPSPQKQMVGGVEDIPRNYDQDSPGQVEYYQGTDKTIIIVR